jgi:dTDP-4-dehydrorhamnose reductase
MVVLVVGGLGQLGQSIKFISSKYPEITFKYVDVDDMDITDEVQVQHKFQEIKPQYCINAAAYTAVDKAETDVEKAHAINVTGVENIAKACKQNNAVLLHVSTDFVFDGNQTKPYTENDAPNPLGVYGQTKLDGERVIPTILNSYYIVRTAWLYSQFANNFMKTMIRLGKERDSLSVVNDQIGTPTHAVDLAEVLIKIIITDHKNLKSQILNLESYGLYHFSNEGQCSWFDFAKKIFEVNNIKIDLLPIPTSAYPTPAKRPVYSVLDKTKIKTVFGIEVRKWEDSLKFYAV